MAVNSLYKLLPDGVTMYTQTEALKEAKDMSKNLVSGEFEREYRGNSRRPNRSVWLTVVIVVVCILTCWLAAITALRELQLSRLRNDLDELSADVLALKLTVKSLNQKLVKKTTDYKAMEDTIYADIDQEVDIPIEDEKLSEKHDSLEKLQDVTVVDGDDDDNDDEDMYYGDDDEEGSSDNGDWYSEYDRRAEHVGKTNMVILKPEDFTGSVKLRPEDKPLSKIRELKRMLNEDPQNPAVFAAATSDMPTEETSRSKRSVATGALVDFVDNFAAPRTFGKDDSFKHIKPKSHQTTFSKGPSRVVRNSDNEDEAQRRPFIAAHFHGNTSHLNPEIHPHYKGNGLVAVSHEAHHSVWYPSGWTAASPHPRPTLTRSGHVKVHHTGVYLVYVQIYYLDSHDVISWVLHRTNSESDDRDTLLQCARTSPSLETRDKPNSCFSASALLLKEGDRLAVRNTGGDRHALMQPEKSFIGLVKLADADVPDEEF